MLSLRTTLLLSLSLLSIDAGVNEDFCWRDYIPGEIPYDALEGAPGRYIGQVNYNGNLVATIIPESKMAVFDMFGRQNVTTNIKIFCTSKPEKFYWGPVNFNDRPTYQMYAAVVGGFRGNLQEEEDEFFKPLFIGRVFHENEWKIGKVVRMGSPVKGLWIWNQAGNGERMIYFDILRYNDTHSGK